MKELSRLAHKKQKGQLLIEILISLFILILVVFGILAGVTVSVRNSSFARNKSLANQYAQECLELIRRKRDTDGLDSISSSDCPVLPSPFNPSPFSNPDVSISGTADQKTVTVSVHWSEGGKNYKTKLTTVLTKSR